MLFIGATEHQVDDDQGSWANGVEYVLFGKKRKIDRLKTEKLAVA